GEQEIGEFGDRLLFGNGPRLPETKGRRHRRDIRSVAGEAALATGLSEALVVEHQDGQIAGSLIGDHRQRADPHQHLAVAGDAQTPAARRGQRPAKRGWDRQAHAAPGIEVFGGVPCREAIPGRTAETGDQQGGAATRQQLGHEGPSLDAVGALVGRAVHFWPNPLAPTTRWPISTAGLPRLLKAKSAAAAKVSPPSSALSTA